MYRIIAYHGKGKNEMASDMHLLWDNFRIFAASRRLRHVYCFQAVDDKNGADMILVIQYEDTVGAPYSSSEATEWPSREDSDAPRMSSKEGIDYWFYVRE